MSYKVIPLENFKREAKRLIKKYPSLKNEIYQLDEQLSVNPLIGQPLGSNCFKIRLAIKSKGKGKSGGARVISCVLVKELDVYLLSIYDKSEKESISDMDMKKLVKDIPAKL
ncbi:MAG: addiction module toxin RelE [Bacteroidales bacterium]|jgi:hypothetical protein